MRPLFIKKTEVEVLDNSFNSDEEKKKTTNFIIDKKAKKKETGIESVLKKTGIFKSKKATLTEKWWKSKMKGLKSGFIKRKERKKKPAIFIRIDKRYM